MIVGRELTRQCSASDTPVFRGRREDDARRGQDRPAVRSVRASPRRRPTSRSGLAARPADLLEVQIDRRPAMGRLLDQGPVGRGRRRAARPPLRAPQWQDDPYYRSIRDSYLLASKQLRELVSVGEEGPDSGRATVRFLLDQYLNAVAPSNFAHTNPEVLERAPRRPTAPIWSRASPISSRTSPAARASSSAAPTRRLRERQDDRRDARRKSCSRTTCSS